MKLTDFDYYLPKEKIAQHPVEPRDHSKLLIVDKTNKKMHDQYFYDLPQFLTSTDLLILNDTRVIPARLYGVRKDTGGHIEFLLLRPVTHDCWEVLVKPGKKAKVGVSFSFGDGLLEATVLENTVVGGRLVQFSYQGDFNSVLDELGEMPLPPYITAKLEDKERYQTVYSKDPGSVAAPTAGLHFTERLLDQIKAQGVNIVPLTLHVGLGTFRPVQTENIEEHKMHTECYYLSEESAKMINDCKKNGGRVIAIGTTVVRTLETMAQDNGKVTSGSGWTDIFIYPGYKFKIVDGLITNFHLPKSSLMMLVSAFSGLDIIKQAYKHAIESDYRFFSFGDAMLLI